jgi:hypothetical protein
MGSSYYVVHPGSGTIVDLDEVWIVEIKDNNVEADNNLSDDDWEELLENADRKWSGRTEVSLG